MENYGNKILHLLSITRGLIKKNGISIVAITIAKNYINYKGWFALLIKPHKFTDFNLKLTL